MKRGTGIIAVLILWTVSAGAQSKKETKSNVDKTPATTTKATLLPQQQPGKQQLMAWGQYNAINQRLSNNANANFSIADPTIRLLNQRANGAPVAPYTKDIIGVPKIVYGLGKGQVLFRSHGATTSGTGTGSGTVGTGSSLGPVGMNGLSLGVNGKSPYAGPIMDGIIVTDINKDREEVKQRGQVLKQQRKQ